MADNLNQPDPKQQQEYNKYAEVGRKIAAEFTAEARDLSAELRDQLGVRQKLNDYDKALLGVARNITSEAAKNRVELGRQGEIQKQLVKDAQTLNTAQTERLLAARGLSKEEIQAADRIAKLNEERLETFKKIEDLQKQYVDAEDSVKASIDKQIQGYEGRLAAQEASLQSQLQAAGTDVERLALANQLVASATKNLGVSQEQEEIQKKIAKSMGVTGSLINSAKGLMDQLGMSSLGNLLNIEKANKELKDQIDLIERAEEVNGKIVYNGKEMSKGMAIAKAKAGAFKNMLSGALNTATSLEAVIGFTLKSLLAASSQTAKFQKQLGISYGAANSLKNEMNMVAMFSGSNFITSEKLVKTFGLLTKEIGMSAKVLGNEALVEATYLTEKLHMSGAAAAQLVSMSSLNGKSAKQTNKELGKQLSTFNKQNKTMFSLKDIMEDVGNASKAVVLTLAKSPKAIAAAASEARKLGTNLAGVEKIADSLLDFESSIEKEMEAQLITGKNLNLARAREAALVGDLETVAKEVGKQEAVREAFATNNVIAQKAAADALGISREELAKMTYQQELARLGAKGFKDQYGEVAYENLKAQSAQDKFNDLLGKVQDILANVLSLFSPIIDAVAWLAGSPLAAPILAAVVAVKALGGSFSGVVKGLGSVFGSLQKVYKKIMETFATEGISGFTDKLKGAGSKIKETFMQGKTEGLGDKLKDKAKDVADSTGDKTKELSDKTKNVKPGKGIKQFLKNLGDGLRSLGEKFGDVLKGIAALGLASVAIVGPLAGAMLIIKDVPAKAMLAFAASIAVLGGSLALVGKQASNVMKGGIALAAVGVGILAAAAGFSMLDGVDPASVVAVTGSLVTLGIAAALLGSLAGNIMTGAAALLVLGAAMVPAAFALSLLKGVDISSIVAFSIALPLLAAAAAGLGFLAPFIMAGAAALAVLGAAMIPAAVAFNIMAKADLEKISTGLTAIASVGPQLALAGAGMVALAAGAAILGIASPALMFAGAALGVLGMGAQIASQADLQGLSAGLTSIGTAAPQLSIAAAGMIGLAGGAIALALASPGIFLAGAALAVLGTGATLLANANFEGITEKLTQLGAIGPGLVQASAGLFAIAGGLTAFALAMAGASMIGGLSTLFGGGVMSDLEALAAMAAPLEQVGISLTAIAAGLQGVALALSTLETSKLDEVKDLVMTTAFAAPMVAATGAITDLISGITGGGKEESSNAELVAKIDELIAAVKEGGDVYIDGNKAGESLMLASVKSS